MQTIQSLSTIAETIQLAVAPVFLLTGVGAILAVMATRFARIVDRYRALKETPSERHAQRGAEMDMLLRRSRWVHWAITLSVISELLICIVIAILFLGTEIHFAPARTVSLLFISAMLMLIAGLLCFLREIFLSTGTITK